MADKEYYISYCLPCILRWGKFSFSIVSWLIGEFQNIKGGMFLQISETWKYTSIIISGQLFSNFLKLEYHGSATEFSEVWEHWMSTGPGLHVLCSCGAAQSISEPALPPWWVGMAPEVPGAAEGIGNVQRGIVCKGMVAAWKALPEKELKVTNCGGTGERSRTWQQSAWTTSQVTGSERDRRFS